MSQPMLEVKKERASRRGTTPHLLPCRIDFNGTVEPSQAFWSPSQSQDGKNVAYFRGRKLQGQKVKLPEGYRGAVVERTDSKAEKSRRRNESEVVDVDEEEEQVDLGTIETKGEFDDMIVWGHETIADAATDPHVRGVEEWLALSEQIHSYPPVQGS